MFAVAIVLSALCILPVEPGESCKQAPNHQRKFLISQKTRECEILDCNDSRQRHVVAS